MQSWLSELLDGSLLLSPATRKFTGTPPWQSHAPSAVPAAPPASCPVDLRPGYFAVACIPTCTFVRTFVGKPCPTAAGPWPQ
eukprot:14897144-Alexandrium_andersonii.AAC.1